MRDKGINFTVCFYTAGLPFTGAPILHQSIGGSESAVWFMARALAARGHRVDIVCNCPSPGVYDGVTYWDTSSFSQLVTAREWDVFISSRVPSALTLPLRTKMNWLWLHDMPTDVNAMAAMLFQTDQILTLSDFHRQAYLKGFPRFDRIMWQTRNGVDIQAVEYAAMHHRHPKRLVYASRPERGLNVLLMKIWPELLKRDPELELHLCGYSMEDWQFSPEQKQFYANLTEIARQSPRVVDHGPMNKADFYMLLGSASLTLYPCVFPEISCIVALESMAAGTPIVTSGDFALNETVPYRRVPGNPAREGYVQEFVDYTMELLTDEILYRRTRKAGQNHVAQRYSWATVAAEWEARMVELFEQRLGAQGYRIAETLLFNSDVVAARKLADELWPESEISGEAERALAVHHQEPNAYFDHSAPDLEWEKVNVRFQGIISRLPPAQPGKTLRVLDMGCGSGALLGHIARVRPDIVAEGWDFSIKLIEYATEKAKSEDLSALTFRCTPDAAEAAQVFLGERFDVVIAAEILEHIVDYRQLISGMERACCPDGLLLLTVPSGPWEACSYSQYGIDTLERYHVHHFEQRDLDEIFNDKRRYQVGYVSGGRSPWGDPLGWWFVSYRNDPKKLTGAVNYERKFLTTRPRPKVAACMITKNEEDNIGKAIRSFLPYVDEVWVWDGGSTDRTREIVQSFTGKYWPRVHLCEQTKDPDGDGLGNFAYLRNESKSRTEADWIYWQDCDEELIGGWNIRKYLTGPFFENFVIRQNHIQIRPTHPIEPDLPNRIFRNRPEYNFWGVIHEQPLADLNTEILPGLRLDDVDIAHYGYMTAAITRYKCVERNLPLLIKDRKLNPNRDIGKLLVQRDYMNLGQIEIDAHHGITERALEYLRASVLLYLEHYRTPDRRYHRQALMYYQLVAKFLGLNGVPVKPEWGIPFEARTLIHLGVGGTEGGSQPETRWFTSAEEYREYIELQAASAVDSVLRVQGLEVSDGRIATT